MNEDLEPCHASENPVATFRRLFNTPALTRQLPTRHLVVAESSYPSKTNTTKNKNKNKTLYVAVGGRENSEQS